MSDYPQIPPSYPLAQPYPPPVRTDSPALGTIALLLTIAGAVGATIIAVFAGVAAGPDVLRALESTTPDGSIDLSLLSPVRGWVLTGEVAFWAGTVLGIWAIVQGGIALASRRGFGAGLAAIIVAAVGPVVFVVALTLALGVGAGLEGL